ncbi:T-lymphocyte activation antigen CD80-like [Sparus aurata]|uniref:T-lymphocyte activation antigen CD80-like n=1 Tax=Sparus aurata TaxID=8175 RepID=UPI0011C134F5|nr:T-lymphocyte activation antigen CD80-like [Sparus aurata]
MDQSLCSSLKRTRFWDCFGVLRAQRCPQRARPAALWRTGLLLCFLTFCACLDEECVLGVVGRPVSLPCLYPQLLSFENFSIEWRGGEEVVLRSVWERSKNVEELGVNSATLPADAALTGNFSLELPTVQPNQHRTTFGLFVISRENQSAALCTVCLRIAASFISPLLQREQGAEGEETSFLCRASGGFPEPVVSWLINFIYDPPEGSVETQATLLPDSHLYNITSHLTANISKESTVTCIVENLTLNETTTSTSYGVKGSPVVVRASDSLWMFSTALCAVVGVMVVVGVAYQIHLDRVSKRKKLEFQSMKADRGRKRRRQYKEESEAMKPKETDV